MTGPKEKTDLLYMIPFFIEHSSQPFATADPDGKITFINRACCDTMGYSENELLAMDWAKDLTSPGWEEIESAKLKELHFTGRPVRYEKEYRHKDGRSVPVELLVHLIRNDSGEPLYYYTFITDLTERKQSEQRLKQALEEKEILMKELQHRVKNNLNIIAGLIDLEMDRLEDIKARGIFASARSRIQSISAIYERLYRSEQIDKVDLYDYISDITGTIAEAFIPEKSEIRFRHELDHVVIDLRRAVPIGLIINEAVSNAVKYAFNGLPCGEILVLLKRCDNEVNLTIRDNGVGLPEGFSIEKDSNLGLTLINMLSGQIEGNAVIENLSGTVITVTFCL